MEVEPWRRGLFDDDDHWEAPATPPRPPPAPVEATDDAPSKALRALARAGDAGAAQTTDAASSEAAVARQRSP